MLPLIFILVDAAAGVHTGVTSLITTLVILTLDSVSLSVFDFFFKHSESPANWMCWSLHWMEHTGHLEYPEKDIGSQEYCLSPLVLPLSAIGAVISSTSPET